MVSLYAPDFEGLNVGRGNRPITSVLACLHEHAAVFAHGCLNTDK